ncbi:MAG: hypothetical protein GY716_10290 [bacterium]|nr:hypothetical protein [bacterium]
MPRVDYRFRTNEAKLFESEGRSGGGRWAPLKRSYWLRKRKLRPGETILRFDGHLERGLAEEGGDHIAEYRNGVLHLGTRDPVAGYAFDGSEHVRKRNPIKHSQEQEREYATVVDGWLKPRFSKWIRGLRSLANRRIPREAARGEL